MNTRDVVLGGGVLAVLAVLGIVVATQSGGSDQPQIGTARPSGTSTAVPTTAASFGPSTGTATSSAGAGTGSATPSSAESTPNSGAITQPGTAQYVAAGYVRNAYALDYRWPNVGHWVDLVKPYSTAANWAQMDQLRKAALTDGGSASDAQLWQQVQAQKTVVRVDVSQSLIVTEAGPTPTHCIVRVVYSTSTANADQAGAPDSPTLTVNATMDRTSGAWLVASTSTAGA